jgi:CheY-like chemotaxis protein
MRRVAEQARRLKAEFAATISHELRAPLNIVIGFSEMMIGDSKARGRQSLPAVYREGMETVHRNAMQILRLVDDVLDLSQIDAHRMALVKDRHNVGSIMSEAAEIISPLYRHLGLTLSLEIPTDLPAVRVDADRVRQVLLNLLNNAARYTDRGGVIIRAASDESNVVVSVQDTGVGISPEDLPYVFDEFRQAGPGERRRSGSGLGLSLCKRLAEMHGGYIWVESEIGHGTTFHLALPTCETVITAPTSRPPRPGLPTEWTVAVLDQGDEVATLLRRFLDGYHVVQASSLLELRQLAASRPIHAVIRTSGYASGERGQDRRNDLLARIVGDVPLFNCRFSTAKSLAEELGVAEYLVKPVSREQVTTALQRVARTAREILIVDDDPDMLTLLTSYVQEMSRHHRVRAARDGAEALACLRDRRPDLVLLDLQLPGIDGVEVIQEMHQDPSLRDIPVIVVTGRAAREEAVKAEAVGLTRAEGLTVGEVTACLRASLDALLSVGAPDSPREPIAAPAPSPALPGIR